MARAELAQTIDPISNAVHKLENSLHNGFSNGEFAQWLEQQKSPLKEAREIVDDTLNQHGTFIDISKAAEGGGGIRVRREVSYTVALHDILEEGLMEPAMLDLLNTVWAATSGGTAGQRDRIELAVSDFVVSTPGKPNPTLYELTARDPLWVTGDLCLRLNQIDGHFFSHAGGVHGYSKPYQQLEGLWEAVNKDPGVANPLALMFVKTLTNPQTIALGQRRSYPHYFGVLPRGAEPVAV